MEAVSQEAVELAKKRYVSNKTERGQTAGVFDVERYLADHGKEVVKVKQNGHSTLCCLKECLFDPSHSPNDAAIGISQDGKLFYQCFHNGCQGRTWKEAREIISGNEPLKAYMIHGETQGQIAGQIIDPFDLSIFVSVSDILDTEEPTRPELWEGEIPQGSLVGISGQWGSMKSYLMQALGLRAAQGKMFLGRRLVQTDFFDFDLENPRSVWKRRLLDLAGPERPERFHMMTLFGATVPPPFDADGIAFYNRLAELYPNSVFLFDSLVRFYAAGKQTENTEDAIHAMTTLKGLTRWGTTVIFLHHPPKNGGEFRGGGDLQAAPDLLFTLKHDKKARRLTLECTKNRFEEEHTIEIGYEPTPEGGLVFVDVATAEEMKQRTEDRERATAVLEIVKELHLNGESTKTRLFDECKKRLNLGRRIVEPIIDNGVGVTWSCTKIRTSHIYAPLCTGPMYTTEGQKAENAQNTKENGYVHDEKTASVHDEHNPNCSCTSCTHPLRVYACTQRADSGNGQSVESDPRFIDAVDMYMKDGVSRQEAEEKTRDIFLSMGWMNEPKELRP